MCQEENAPICIRQYTYTSQDLCVGYTVELFQTKELWFFICCSLLSIDPKRRALRTLTEGVLGGVEHLFSCHRGPHLRITRLEL